MEHYSAIKASEILPSAATRWMAPGAITLKDTNQGKTDTTVSFMCRIENEVNTTETS